jgi:hypothetical protein
MVFWFFFGEALKPEDSLVLVLGTSGDDKSSFIRVLKGRTRTANATEPCAETSKIKSFYTSMIGFPVELLDAPEFTDDTLSDAEIFEDISFTLATMRENGRKLSGVIYVMNST